MGYKTRAQLATTVDEELLVMMRDYSKQSRIPLSKLIDEAMEDLLLKYKVIEKKSKTPNA